jgi:acetyltransferase-like isoleucine patch superfamily enzyme
MAYFSLIKILYRDSIKINGIYSRVEAGVRIKINGKKSKIIIGNKCYIRRNSDIESHQGIIEIGDRVFFNKNLTLVSRKEILIGDNCIFGEDISIYDHNHSFENKQKPIRDQGFNTASVKIGCNVWVGCKTYIGSGVTIGDNVLIAAGSIVIKSIPDNSKFIAGKVTPLYL